MTESLLFFEGSASVGFFYLNGLFKGFLHTYDRDSLKGRAFHEPLPNLQK